MQYLVTPEGQKNPDGRSASQCSQLKNLIRSLSYGKLRGVGSERKRMRVFYNVIQIPFLIEPKRHSALTSVQQQLSSVEFDNSNSHRRWERRIGGEHAKVTRRPSKARGHTKVAANSRPQCHSSKGRSSTEGTMPT
jgi:hypothetical protein